eukprot:6824934-Pyramimonas_sp.AAC.1
MAVVLLGMLFRKLASFSRIESPPGASSPCFSRPPTQHPAHSWRQLSPSCHPAILTVARR